MKSAAIVATGITAVSAFNVFPRQNDNATCAAALSDAQSILESYPPIPTDEAFLTWVFEQDLPTGEEAEKAENPCYIPAASGDPSNVATYSSFIAQVTSWIGENRDSVASVYSACESNSVFRSIRGEFGLPDDASSLCESFTIGTVASSGSGSVPSSAAASTTGSGSGPLPTGAPNATTTTGTGHSSSGGEAAASSSEPAEGSAARQTGMTVAALVGVVAAVALL
ncbi:hypothetical protein F5X68DRAFT_266286 [Plectosphaerella plurivora]|uniref:Uncharacterized protein n=1 Tax=Plectosphaerella plurivora TaxID=936078 RepID=A0A9P8UZS2_9PEZI|nr:hypothetical protein F5X68DRAFT_266286 [Plectosphaerella plurivora]